MGRYVLNFDLFAMVHPYLQHTPFQVIPWGDPGDKALQVPSDLKEVIDLYRCGGEGYVALTKQGDIRSWGDVSWNITSVVSLLSGRKGTTRDYLFALRGDGTVEAFDCVRKSIRTTPITGGAAQGVVALFISPSELSPYYEASSTSARATTFAAVTNCRRPCSLPPEGLAFTWVGSEACRASAPGTLPYDTTCKAVCKDPGYFSWSATRGRAAVTCRTMFVSPSEMPSPCYPCSAYALAAEEKRDEKFEGESTLLGKPGSYCSNVDGPRICKSPSYLP